MTADTSDDPDRSDELRAAAAAVDRGELVVYPTETVYGLGADALDAAAVERAFDLKGRDRSNPLSLGVASVDDALRYTRPTERAVAFARAFLPGPVTVVVERGDRVPDALTAGRDHVGIRVPDHDLARALMAETGPLTATSANVSGTGSVTDLGDLDDRVREGVAAVIDGGETPGTESTVVDPDAGTIHRRGAMAGAIEAWLADPPVDG
ncbi:Sua5/YciO/YrdC/YwlC family protein [Halorubrum coriense DSM 10284]|uniref:L-threonylcarbamoyladenylate synthase n=1 Tax=Halorubrum coriense DSM 10284 TaxID=1227466 RepID=M0EVF7_9EURY|nr:L-threonylcarbamoyladenylate synthase [Halorubrum coriense]ELZ50409.1 Sua5/YciO/YrdC/YwlC family protein [Halorubrum coriense DSM 10284]